MSSDRLNQGLAHWPALAARAGLPETGWMPRLLASRRDGKGDRIVIRLDHPDHPPVVCKQGIGPTDIASTVAAIKAQQSVAMALSANPEARVPQILAILPGRGAIAMRAIDGQHLTSLIETGFTAAPLRRAGEWVDAFHRIGPVERRAFQPRFIVNHLVGMTDQVRKGARQIAQASQFCAFVDALARQSAAAQGAPTVSSLRHGDLNGRNLILSEQAVWGIDFADAGTGPVGYDIARLLVHLAERIPSRRVDAPVPPEMLAAFFDGYRLTGADDVSVRFLILARILSNWAGLPGRDEDMTLIQTIRFHRIVALAEAGFA